MTQKQKTHHIAVAAMLCAVAFVLQFIEFSIPLIPSFVKLDLSDLPALICKLDKQKIFIVKQ